jgi:hypothetical protein
MSDCCIGYVVEVWFGAYDEPISIHPYYLSSNPQVTYLLPL